jgi:hypothetical protein
LILDHPTKQVSNIIERRVLARITVPPRVNVVRPGDQACCDRHDRRRERPERGQVAPV